MSQYELQLGPWIADLQEADLPPQLRELASVVGVEGAVKIAQHYGGQQFYVAKLDAVLRQLRDQMVRRDKALIGYKGCAHKYGLSEVWVRQLCDHQGDDDQQQDLF
ncbi:hypothetical protein FY034_13040 [Trichlorobacter lovleyi]|uniref:Mor transcription activator family protein n=1 Tax=Trichlorobacter lovleyi TaxID=313985 RepID=UPI00223F515B|nr:Mor transcription activator family protein [Trichlorobacter lovleyi]QOX79817.1 hypothetical protein FY034_13040 [Trichlorobacter lovleyi]